VSVRWVGTNELSLWVVNSAGHVVAQRRGNRIYLETDVPRGSFTFTVQSDGSQEVSYKVSIQYGIAE
jgi:hypothetical protein